MRSKEAFVLVYVIVISTLLGSAMIGTLFIVQALHKNAMAIELANKRNHYIKQTNLLLPRDTRFYRMFDGGAMINRLQNSLPPGTSYSRSWTLPEDLFPSNRIKDFLAMGSASSSSAPPFPNSDIKGSAPPFLHDIRAGAWRDGVLSVHLRPNWSGFYIPGAESFTLRTISTHIRIWEIPTIQFSFITRNAPFDAENSTSTVVNGIAIFNQGITGALNELKHTDPGTMWVYLGEQGDPIPATPPFFQSSTICSGYWSETGSFSARNGSADDLDVLQSYFYDDFLLTEIDWSTSSPPPVMPDGVSMETIGGRELMVLDLDNTNLRNIFYIKSALPPAPNRFLVLKGTTSTTVDSLPVTIICDYPVILSGNNSRPVVFVSRYRPATKLSDPDLEMVGAYHDLASPAGATPLTLRWRGIFRFEDLRPGLLIGTPTSNGKCVLIATGSFCFSGGTLSLGSNPDSAITINPDPTLVGILTRITSGTQSDVVSDKIFLAEFRLP